MRFHLVTMPYKKTTIFFILQETNCYTFMSAWQTSSTISQHIKDKIARTVVNNVTDSSALS